MNSAYELALKEVGTAWKGGDFVTAMLARAHIPYPALSGWAAVNDWGHPIEAKDARPGDVVVTNRAGQTVAVFFGRRMGAFAECLGVADDGTVKPMRFQVKGFAKLLRPPRPQPIGVAPLVAEFVKPGAGSKPVEMRKADPVQAVKASQSPQPKPRILLGWVITFVAGISLGLAILAEVF